MTKNQTRIRETLDGLLARYGQRAINDGEWGDLEDDGLVDAALKDPQAFTRALRFMMEQRAKYSNTAVPQPAAPRMLDTPESRGVRRKTRRSADEERRWHEHALSYAFAALANRNSAVGHGDEVFRFRSEILGGKLLAYETDALDSWIAEHHAKQDSGPVTLGSLALPSARAFGPVTGFLDYATPDGGWGRHVLVRAGTVLDKLRALSEKLADFYPWQAAQAATFVLTAGAPWVESIAVTTSFKSPFLVRSRIRLVVDPFSTPQEVAAAYAQARKQLFPFLNGRIRRLSEKHARLAEFACEHQEDLGQAMFDDWNSWCRKERKPWVYKHVSQFVRDALQAMDRLLGLGSRARRRPSGGGADPALSTLGVIHS